MAGILDKVTRKPRSLPPRIVLYAAEKFGKTSFAANFSKWNPVFLMTAAETGLLTLLESSLIPPVDHFPEDFKSHATFKQALWSLRDEEHSFNALVVDTGNGAETLTVNAVVDEKYNGDKIGFNDYGKGIDIASDWWAQILETLDQIREQRKMAVIMLYHAKVKGFNNPVGKDFDQWRPEAHDKLWAKTHKWADAILYGGFKTQIYKDKDAGEFKAEGNGEVRYLRCTASGPIVAGNRYGLPDEINAPAGAANLCGAFMAALKKARGTDDVEGSKLGAVPTLEEFTKLITSKGRNYDKFIAWAKKSYPAGNFSMYGKIHMSVINRYIELMHTLPDVAPGTETHDAGSAEAPKTAEGTATGTTNGAAGASTSPPVAPEATKETPPVEKAPDAEKPASDAATAPVEPKAETADEGKEREELEIAAQEYAEQIGYKVRGLMELHLPKCGYKPKKDDTLGKVPLPILRKFIAELQTHLDALGSNK